MHLIDHLSSSETSIKPRFPVPQPQFQLTSFIPFIMGTRGLIGFITQAARHACYNNNDSYPDDLGQRMVDFILSLTPEQIVTMASNVRRAQVRFLLSSPLDVNRPDASMTVQWVDPDTVDGEKSSETIWEIQEGSTGPFGDSIDFLKDGLFCEWAYFMDFENQKFETWASGKLVDTITFEGLRENKEYMNNMQGLDDEEAEAEE